MKKMHLASPVASKGKIVLFSVLAAIPVLVASLLVQWLVYDDWLHRTGPLRIVGTCIAALVTFVFALRWQTAIRERQLEMLAKHAIKIGLAAGTSLCRFAQTQDHLLQRTRRNTEEGPNPKGHKPLAAVLRR
jgi:uncharacterized SAM-binding protein YcdF (DUF218 family)